MSELNREQTVEMLVDRLIDYKANVFNATESNIAEVIAERLGEKSRYVVPTGLNPEWLPRIPQPVCMSPIRGALSNPARFRCTSLTTWMRWSLPRPYRALRPAPFS